VNGGVYQFGVPRTETISDNGMTVPPSMGVATAITSNRRAVVGGNHG